MYFYSSRKAALTNALMNIQQGNLSASSFQRYRGNHNEASFANRNLP